MVGDVVLAPLPFTDLSEIKVRPAVVLADVGTQDWVLCQRTSKSPARDRHMSIGPNDMKRGRLRFRSWVRPDRLYTVNERVFRRTIGRLSVAKHTEITIAVRGLFSVPK